MFEKETIQNIFDGGIAFLQRQQEKKGNFLSLSFTQVEDSFGGTRYHSLFFTPLILDALQVLPQTTQMILLKKRTVSLLLSQKSEHWSFNYWIRNSSEAAQMPYPDDLDDTFCALAALFRYDPKLIDGAAMAEIVQLLTATEAKEGGPYRTWLVPNNSHKKWKDIDIAVNSNIAYFLSLHNVELPKLTSFIEKHIKQENFISPYYPSEYPVIYFISRFYKGKYCERLQEILLSKQDANHSWGNPLQTALAVSALLRLGCDPEKLQNAVAYLVGKKKNNSWQPYAFCIDPTRDGKIHYAGSSALTTAFCLEAIARYQQSLEVQAASYIASQEELLYEKIEKRVDDFFSLFEKGFREKAASLLQKLLRRKEGRQIPLMPFYFAQTLGEKSKEIDEELLVQLGAANMFGWIAYTIYDDFLDDEGDPVMLSVANVAHRELTVIFESLFTVNNGFRAFYRTVMDRLDEANAWEVTHCRMKVENGVIDGQQVILPRYGNYERLAYKSLGHGLGPIAVLFALGYSWDSTEVKDMVSFFEHYLIAKQLNDDAHDWEDDLKKGHSNPVVARLLQKLYATEGKRAMTIMEMLPRLQQLFWLEVIDEVCDSIFEHTKKARNILKRSTIIGNLDYLEEMLAVYDNAAYRVLHERTRALQFVEAYNVTIPTYDGV